MIFQGISIFTAAVGAAAALGVLVALQFLKVRHPGRVIPSIMLWQAAVTPPHRRFLREKFTRPLSMLAAALAILALLAAATEPVWEPGPPAPRTVIVALPGNLAAATELRDRLDPLHTAVVLAAGSGIILQEFAAPRRRLTEPDPPPRADEDAVLELAELLAGPTGTVCWLGPVLPPWLPKRAVFLRAPASAAAAAPEKPLTLALPDAPEPLRRMAAALPHTTLTGEPERAAVVFHTSLPAEAGAEACETELEVLYEQLMRSGVYGSHLADQRLRRAPEASRLPAARSHRLTGWLFALALAAAAADLWLWHKQKAV